MVKYSDLLTDFSTHPIHKDLLMKNDIAAIKQSLKNLLRTNSYERLYQPRIGSNISALLFEPATPLTGQVLSDAIKSTIKNHEPRVSLINLYVTALPDLNAYAVSLIFRVNASGEQSNLEIQLDRIR